MVTICSVIRLFVVPTKFFKHGTIVIVRKTKDTIYVGADTKLTLEGFNKATRKFIIRHELFCKIATQGKFNYAVIGGSIVENLQVAFEVCKSNATFNDVMKSYIKSFHQIVQKNILEIRQSMPNSEFKKVIQKRLSNYYCQCIFFGVDNNVLFSKNILCSIKDPYSTPVSLQWSASDAPTLFGGEIQTIKDTVLNEDTWKGEPLQTIEKLIKSVAEKSPDDINDKVDLVKVTKTETIWIKKNN